MKLATIVQHHPAREHLLEALLERLPSGAAVVTDPEPDHPVSNPWRCYRECILSIPDDATHALIVQDDAIPHPDFPVVVERCVSARPDRIVCYFVASHPVRGARQMLAAYGAGAPWAEMFSSEFLPVIATSWPAPLAREFLAWADAHTRQGSRSDDGVAGRFIRSRAIRPIATIPSLVQHPDVERSLIGKRAMEGKNPARVALIPPDGRDILSIEWE